MATVMANAEVVVSSSQATSQSLPISVLDLIPTRAGEPASSAIVQSVELARHVEQLGYKRYWVAEHHSIQGLVCSATPILIGHIAAATKKIRVGSGGVMLPNHAPLVVAEQFGTLESMYPGRIDLGLGERLFERVGEHLQQKGLRLNAGTIVDATIINAPSSTKNARQERDPEMHQTRKGKQWYFGMKAHVGVDSQTKLIHSVVATAANAADCTMLPHLLHGAETRVWGDQAYRGQGEVLREHAPHALDFTNQRYRYKHYIDEVEREKNRTKSGVRSKVEHVFAVMKLKFGFVKVRYRGLDKNANRLFVTCALVNLFLVRKRLLTTTAA